MEAELRATVRGPRLAQALDEAERAVTALERERFADAERSAGRLKRLAPRSSAAREILGIALYRRERYREALRELQAYRRMTGRSDQNHLIADSHRALGSPERAVPLAQEALRARISPEVKAEAVVVAGSALADLGRFEQALTLLRRFRTDPRAARPYDLRIWYVTGDVLERAGQREAASEEFGRIVRHDPDAFDAADRLAALSDRSTG
ncbi:MAG TPA: tetratricopeptide repeat protein [Actinomycetota bacterium]|nr:tetratricopeptide repeat protein [Actinomycetota bacterium]